MLEHRIPPPLVAIVVALAMWGLSKLLPPMALASGLRYALAGAIALAGLAFSLAGVSEFRRARTTVNPLQPARATALVTGGVYRITRNPMYVGLLLVLLAWAVLLASPVSLAGPVAFIVFIDRFQIEPEERALAARFGAQFEAYRARVRRWL